MTSFTVSILMRRIRSCGGETDTMELTQLFHLPVEELLSSVAHEVLRGSMELDPVSDDVGRDGVSPLILDKTSGKKYPQNIL